MKYARILQAVYSTPWCIHPPKLQEILQFLHFAAGGGKFTEAELTEVRLGRRTPVAMDDHFAGAPKAVARPPRGVEQQGRVGLIQIFGTICQRMSDMDCSGGTSTEMIAEGLDALLADKTCKAIVLQIDSPGGAVTGVQELADKIYRSRDQKKIQAIADGMAASAAYWLGCQAEEFCCTPSGMAGSIGCFSAHEDCSKACEEMGVKTTLVSAGKYKIEGNQFGPLDEEARAAMQSVVDTYYGAFVAAVARGRATTEAKVRSGYGQGRLLTADAAKAAGLVDKVATMDQVLNRLGAAPSGPGASAFTPVIDAEGRPLCWGWVEFPAPAEFGPSVDSRRRRLQMEELT